MIACRIWKFHVLTTIDAPCYGKRLYLPGICDVKCIRFQSSMACRCGFLRQAPSYSSNTFLIPAKWSFSSFHQWDNFFVPNLMHFFVMQPKLLFILLSLKVHIFRRFPMVQYLSYQTLNMWKLIHPRIEKWNLNKIREKWNFLVFFLSASFLLLD